MDFKWRTTGSSEGKVQEELKVLQAYLSKSFWSNATNVFVNIIKKTELAILRLSF